MPSKTPDQSWTVVQLKDKLRAMGLGVSGVKAVLLQRLRNAKRSKSRSRSRSKSPAAKKKAALKKSRSKSRSPIKKRNSPNKKVSFNEKKSVKVKSVKSPSKRRKSPPPPRVSPKRESKNIAVARMKGRIPSKEWRLNEIQIAADSVGVSRRGKKEDILKRIQDSDGFEFDPEHINPVKSVEKRRMQARSAPLRAGKNPGSAPNVPAAQEVPGEFSFVNDPEEATVEHCGQFVLSYGGSSISLKSLYEFISKDQKVIWGDCAIVKVNGVYKYHIYNGQNFEEFDQDKPLPKKFQIMIGNPTTQQLIPPGYWSRVSRIQWLVCSNIPKEMREPQRCTMEFDNAVSQPKILWYIRYDKVYGDEDSTLHLVFYDDQHSINEAKTAFESVLASNEPIALYPRNKNEIVTTDDGRVFEESENVLFYNPHIEVFNHTTNIPIDYEAKYQSDTASQQGPEAETDANQEKLVFDQNWTFDQEGPGLLFDENYSFGEKKEEKKWNGLLGWGGWMGGLL